MQNLLLAVDRLSPRGSGKFFAWSVVGLTAS